jgi:O-antigen/teichoic acid export membrane protein
MVFAIINLPFWSAFTKAWVEKDIAWIKNSIRTLQYVWLLFVLIAMLMVVFSDFIYKLWVGNMVVVPVSLSLVIAFFVVVNTWNAIFSQFLNGVGKIRLQLYSSIIGAALNIPLAIYFGRKFGIMGVVLSSVVLTGFNMGWGYIQYKKIIQFKASGIWAK